MLERLGTIIGVIAVLLFSFPVSAQYKMHFFVPDFPPYTTVDLKGSPVGIGIEKMGKVLASLDVEYSIEVGQITGEPFLSCAEVILMVSLWLLKIASEISMASFPNHLWLIVGFGWF
ncbi:hypothetical protein KP803_10340 [Vibrio sp. ZSDE26]|uniref:Uncharacterized protein n=1 Tax=Vibrio amylolyticus TaxID=2847292 RepID=A0A9X1XJ05_9VIBR|nr:hypothetical protein [Vibrio amylolyticus]MCK6263671.1 hypothetical protein [Vibrio amylolyticus]